MLEPGLEATAKETVTDEMTAERLGSGDVPVLGTPALLALVERAAVAAVTPALEPGQTSVGSRVDLEHVAPTPVGAEVSATARLDAVNGHALSFSFQATDGSGVVGHGTHERMIVDRTRFLRRLGDRG